MKRVLVPLLLAVTVACARPATTPPTAAPPAKEGTVRMQSPLQVSWEKAELTPGKLRLVARVHRIAPLAVPLLVRVEAPAGATLAQGRASFTLEPNAAAFEVLEPVELTFAAVPAQDLWLKVDGETRQMGLHAAAVYRFGRPEPVAPEVPATGPAVQRGGKSLGPSVPLAE